MPVVNSTGTRQTVWRILKGKRQDRIPKLHFTFDDPFERPGFVPQFKSLKAEELERELPDLEDRLLLLDFDETLWLLNSTEEFLAQARPAWLARAILTSVILLRPVGRRLWPEKWFYWKDWMRVRSITFLMPWCLRSWRRRAKTLGREHQNIELIRILTSKTPLKVVVVSNGFRPLISPLLDGMELQVDQLIAAPLISGGAWRQRGKRVNAEAEIPPQTLDDACFVTDHLDDADLLSRVGAGIVCVWPKASFRRPGAPVEDVLSSRS